MASRYSQSAEHRRSLEYLTAENERLRAQNEALREQFRNIENDIWRGFLPDLRMKPAERLACDSTLSSAGAGKQFRDLPAEIRTIIWRLAAGPRLKTIFQIKEHNRYDSSRWPRPRSQEPVEYALVVSDSVFRRRVKVSQVCSEARCLLAPTFVESADVTTKRPGDPAPPGKGGNYNFAMWIWFDPALDSLQLPSVSSYAKELEVCGLIHGPIPRVLLPMDFNFEREDIPRDVLIRPFFNLEGCESIGFIGRTVMLPPESQVPHLLAADLGGGVPLAMDIDDSAANAALLDIFAQYPPKTSWKLTRETYRHDACWGPWAKRFRPRNTLVNPGIGWHTDFFTSMVLHSVAHHLWKSRADLLQAGPFPGVENPWCQEHKLLREFPAIKPIIVLVQHKPRRT